MAAHVEYAVTLQTFTSRFRTLSLSLSLSPINSDAVLNIHLDETAHIILMRSVIKDCQQVKSLECLVRDQRATGSSLTGCTALCTWARHINPC